MYVLSDVLQLGVWCMIGVSGRLCVNMCVWVLIVVMVVDDVYYVVVFGVVEIGLIGGLIV